MAAEMIAWAEEYPLARHSWETRAATSLARLLAKPNRRGRELPP